MNSLVALLALLSAPEPESEPRGRTYLASLSGLRLAEDERILRVTIETWGVDWLAVCRIPKGWRIEAGGSAAPDGSLIGEAMAGAALLPRLTDLDDLALVRLSAPIREHELVEPSARIPATIVGSLDVQAGDGPERQMIFGHANIRLVPAEGCPPLRD